MTPADASRLLAIAAAFDRRTVGEADAVAWADALTGLDPRECAEAVRAHFRETTDYLMPAHVRERVRVAHRQQRDRRHNERVFAEIEAAKETAIQPAVMRERVRELVEGIADQKGIPS
jgi:hypothetical protein